MRNTTKTGQAGFTLTELVVLVGAGSLLAGLLLADLSQTKMKVLQQACAGNLKQWGMAIDLYSQDYNGTFYYSVGGAAWNDSPFSPYPPYVVRAGDNSTVVRAMRICPSVAQRFANPTTVTSYSMPIGQYRKGLSYRPANATGSPFFDGANYWPNLKSCPKPSKFLLLLDANGNTLLCGGLHSAVTTSGTSVDTLPPIQRHLALINCLFGDYHVEPLPIENIDAMDGNCTSTSSPNYTFTLN